MQSTEKIRRTVSLRENRLNLDYAVERLKEKKRYTLKFAQFAHIVERTAGNSSAQSRDVDSLRHGTRRGWKWPRVIPTIVAEFQTRALDRESRQASTDFYPRFYSGRQPSISRGTRLSVRVSMQRHDVPCRTAYVATRCHCSAVLTKLRFVSLFRVGGCKS